MLKRFVSCIAGVVFLSNARAPLPFRPKFDFTFAAFVIRLASLHISVYNASALRLLAQHICRNHRRITAFSLSLSLFSCLQVYLMR